MIRTVTLHGGPHHGEQFALRQGQTLVTVIRPRPGALERAFDPEATPAEAAIDIQTGTYSPVSGQKDTYEWDGWK